MVYFKETIIFQGFREGVQLFPGGGGGVEMLISIETHRACDFPGRGGGSLDLCMDITLIVALSKPCMQR